uniref:Uncharacterized protein n=1 Tax=Arundo donax TaxID=35708 RepID=A0A0A9GS90_ARUDO
MTLSSETYRHKCCINVTDIPVELGSQTNQSLLHQCEPRRYHTGNITRQRIRETM